MAQESVGAALLRGGTSKGAYFERSDLPPGAPERERLLLDAFGSPDPMQVDGVGGSHSTASKAMIVGPAAGDADAEYLFGQVGVEKPVVDWGGNCGNLTFGVGPFALDRGLVDAGASDGRADLVLQNANTGTVVEQSVPVDDAGAPRYAGDFRVHGVPGTGARIDSRFLEPGGSVTGGLFPTGRRVDAFDVPALGSVEASVLDVSSPVVFARAGDVGLTARETPDEIDETPGALEDLERIRSAAAERLGFVKDAADATRETPGIPKMAVVGERRSYATPAGETVDAGSFDLLARILSMQKAHHAYAVTGAMCTAAAALLPGTIPNEFVADGASESVAIGHPKGPLSVDVDVDGGTVAATTVGRTARKLMDGRVYYRG